MPVPDRQKQRREYVRKKTFLRLKLNAGVLMLLGAAYLTAACGLASLICLILTFATLKPACLLLTILLTLFTGGGVFACRKIRHFMNHTDRQARAIRYVPPFAPEDLPAEEILVRSSQEPKQEQSAVLLRVAKNADTSAEELLRTSLGNGNDPYI